MNRKISFLTSFILISPLWSCVHVPINASAQPVLHGVSYSVRPTIQKNIKPLNDIYLAALKTDPACQGSFIFFMKIESDGHVSEIYLVKSELNNSKLEIKLLTYLRQLKFPLSSPWEGSYRLNFINNN